MIGLFKGVFASINQKDEKKVLLVGLEGAGKSVGDGHADLCECDKEQDEQEFPQEGEDKADYGSKR